MSQRRLKSGKFCSSSRKQISAARSLTYRVLWTKSDASTEAITPQAPINLKLNHPIIMSSCMIIHNYVDLDPVEICVTTTPTPETHNNYDTSFLICIKCVPLKTGSDTDEILLHFI